MLWFLTCQSRPQRTYLDSSKPSSWYTEKNKEADTAAFKELVNQSLKTNMPSGAVNDIIRLGPKKNNTIRPLKVSFQDINVKRDILGKAKLLAHGPHKNVFISPDLTPQQREKDRKLRAELKSRRGDGETELYINKGKIVQRKKSEQEPVDSDMPELANSMSSESEEDSIKESDIYSDVSIDELNDETNVEESVTETEAPTEPTVVNEPAPAEPIITVVNKPAPAEHIISETVVTEDNINDKSVPEEPVISEIDTNVNENDTIIGDENTGDGQTHQETLLDNKDPSSTRVTRSKNMAAKTNE